MKPNTHIQPWIRIPKLLTVLEASQALRISVSMTYALLQSGRLQGKRIGANGHRGRWIVPASAINTYVEGLHD